MKHTSTLLMLTLGLCAPALADDQAPAPPPPAPPSVTERPPLEPIPQETFLQRVNRLENLLERKGIRGRRGKTPAGHRYRTQRPKMSDAILAEQLAKDLCFKEPTIERRRYPRQRVQGAGEIDGKQPRFAAKETILDFGNGLKVRRMTFPNEQVAQDWAGAEVNRSRKAPFHSGKPRVFEVRGDSAVLLEGPKALDTTTAAHALREAWDHEAKPGASKKHTDLFSVDDGKGRVARMTDNRVVRARIFPNAPVQTGLPPGFPEFEVAGDAAQLDRVLRTFNALSPHQIQRYDPRKVPTLAPTSVPAGAKKTGATQQVDKLLGHDGKPVKGPE